MGTFLRRSFVTPLDCVRLKLIDQVTDCDGRISDSTLVGGFGKVTNPAIGWKHNCILQAFAFWFVVHLSPLWIQMDTIRLMNMDAATMPAIQVSDDAVAHTVMVYFPLLSVV